MAARDWALETERASSGNVVAVRAALSQAGKGTVQDRALLRALRQLGAPMDGIGYDRARKILFSRLDNCEGYVRGVYTGRVVATDSIPDADGEDHMNTEHTWPRSHGLRGTAGVRDLHHLFPTDTQANNVRDDLPFGEVVTPDWESGGAKRGLDAQGRQVFEPPDAHKGNVARAIFYVSMMYDLKISKAEEAVLKRWNSLDQVDAREQARNDAVEDIQGNRNPFVDDPALANRIANF